jgi:hypothetical protein
MSVSKEQLRARAKADLDLARDRFIGSSTEILWSSSSDQVSFIRKPHLLPAVLLMLFMLYGIVHNLIYFPQAQKETLSLVFGIALIFFVQYVVSKSRQFVFLSKTKLTLVINTSKDNPELFIIPLENIQQVQKPISSDELILKYSDDTGKTRRVSIPAAAGRDQAFKLIQSLCKV